MDRRKPAFDFRAGMLYKDKDGVGGCETAAPKKKRGLPVREDDTPQ
jgi:hypothetical protein